jgi:Ca-activated chloride channel homolog
VDAFTTWLADNVDPAFAAFHFLRPVWLWGLVPAALLVWVIGWRDDVRRRWRGLIAPHLLDALVIERRRGWRVRPVHITALLIALGAIAVAGPTWEQEKPPFVEDRAPLAVAIDLSQTMDAIDVTPTRLERAKLKLKALLAHRQGGRTALYAYAGSTHLVLPLTDDAKLLSTFVDALQTGIMPVSGRDTARALKTIAADLAKEAVPGTILFITDGIEPAATAAFAEQVKSGQSQPLVLAIGTPEGGPLRRGASGFVEGPGGQRVFARLDLDALKAFKADTGVPLSTFTADDADVTWVQRRVQSHLAQKEAEGSVRWKESGWWLTIPIALLSALWFRRGWTVRWVSALLIGVALQGSPERAMAQETTARPWHFVDLWLTPDQQGRRAFERGDYAEAAKHFTDPMWRGAALYRAGKYAEAEQSFARVDSPESDFNQANALAWQGRYEAAVARYRQALTRRPGWPQAQANLAIVQALVPKKPKDKDEGDAAEDPNMKPDQIQFDDKGKAGKQQVRVATKQTAETWMRMIQTTPTDLLARKFALQRQRDSKEGP